LSPVRPPIEVFGASFQNPILLAAGTAGFGREIHDVIDLDRLGGIITKSVSREPRTGYPPPRVAEFAGGMVNAVGLANPGVAVVVREELPWLEANLTRARVFVSVVGDTVDDYVAVVESLGEAPVVTAIEVNLSCPNTERGGEHFGADTEVMSALLRRCKAATAKPIVAKLAPTLSDIAMSARAAAAAGCDGIAVINTIPGALLGPAHGARLGWQQGGVSGPALVPVGVLATRRVRDATGLPVIGVGGVRTIDDVRQYLRAGATLVAVGTAALASPRVPERLARGWARG